MILPVHPVARAGIYPDLVGRPEASSMSVQGLALQWSTE